MAALKHVALELGGGDVTAHSPARSRDVRAECQCAHPTDWIRLQRGALRQRQQRRLDTRHCAGQIFQLLAHARNGPHQTLGLHLTVRHVSFIASFRSLEESIHHRKS
eukprot:7387218-Prymnesium_polylepis.2